MSDRLWISPHKAAEIVRERWGDEDPARARKQLIADAARGYLTTSARRWACASHAANRAEEEHDCILQPGVWMRMTPSTISVQVWEVGDFELTFTEPKWGWMTIVVDGAAFDRNEMELRYPAEGTPEPIKEATPADNGQQYESAEKLVFEWYVAGLGWTKAWPKYQALIRAGRVRALSRAAFEAKFKRHDPFPKPGPKKGGVAGE